MSGFGLAWQLLTARARPGLYGLFASRVLSDSEVIVVEQFTPPVTPLSCAIGIGVVNAPKKGPPFKSCHFQLTRSSVG
jgi:hypothetical protein